MSVVSKYWGGNVGVVIILGWLLWVVHFWVVIFGGVFVNGFRHLNIIKVFVLVWEVLTLRWSVKYFCKALTEG